MIPTRTLFALASLSLFMGCSSVPTDQASATVVPQTATSKPEQDALMDVRRDFVPHLWSDHKFVAGTAEQCARRGEDSLRLLGFDHVVRNGTFVYGNFFGEFSGNRAAVKCVAMADRTFAYTMVAGPRVKLVERLRNEIVWRLDTRED
ncbi:hypothetical protein [Marinobacter xestospongiae]|uniref:Uncharacterized protein n=1 Tax=Marinobacter xestospongiae TaxID=994319 RepID=A0ABU3VT32_9GAMM|nr:hypothetical protein [Marinobacter xestospongiae]MDV2077428.1 hypothetical protein [Marinobacter xestospongiae]